MTTSYLATGIGQATTPESLVLRLIKKHWSAHQARRERARVRAILYAMPDRELKDIGITRSEIEFVMIGSGYSRQKGYRRRG
jgi:uncharacterized protein YjiS (DUF1127 family)